MRKKICRVRYMIELIPGECKQDPDPVLPDTVGTDLQAADPAENSPDP